MRRNNVLFYASDPRGLAIEQRREGAGRVEIGNIREFMPASRAEGGTEGETALASLLLCRPDDHLAAFARARSLCEDLSIDRGGKEEEVN